MRKVRFAISVGQCCIVAMLYACATEATPPPQVQTVRCLPMATYTQTYETALAAATASLPSLSPLVQAMIDYAALRAADRACLTQTH